MNYTIEKLENSKVKFVIETTADELESATQEAYEKNKHKYGVEGFRKGHVPRKVLESVYGKGLFYEDALDIILPKYFDEVLIKEPEIEPVGKPEADIIAFEETGVNGRTGRGRTQTRSGQTGQDRGSYRGPCQRERRFSYHRFRGQG